MKLLASSPISRNVTRLAEAKIKEAILHPEKLVRHEALFHFAESFSRDTEVMPLARA